MHAGLTVPRMTATQYIELFLSGQYKWKDVRSFWRLNSINNQTPSGVTIHNVPDTYLIPEPEPPTIRTITRAIPYIALTLIVLRSAHLALRVAHLADLPQIKQYLLSYVTHNTATDLVSPDTFRATFNETPLVVHKPPKGHTHGESAANRSTATHTAESIAALCGLTPFFYQRSRCDERAGRPGNRSWFWFKDFATTPLFALPHAHSLCIHVDTDYYEDMNTILLDNFQPTVIYTFQPDDAAATRSDYSYTFDSTNTVTYSVHGGAQYTHKVWNYAGDSIIAVRKLFGLIPYGLATYLIDRRRVSDDHYLVAFSPVARWSGPFALLAFLFTKGEPLRRLRTNVDGFTRLEILSTKGHMMSTAAHGSHLAATVPIKTDNAIATVARTGKNDLIIPTVEAMISGHPGTPEQAIENKQRAAVLTEYHRSKLSTKPDIIFPVDIAIHR